MTPRSLIEFLADIPDPRDRRGVRHPLAAVLGLTVVAVLSGMKSLEAIAQFGRDRGPGLAFAWGSAGPRRRLSRCSRTCSGCSTGRRWRRRSSGGWPPGTPPAGTW